VGTCDEENKCRGQKKVAREDDNANEREERARRAIGRPENKGGRKESHGTTKNAKS